MPGGIQGQRGGFGQQRRAREHAREHLRKNSPVVCMTSSSRVTSSSRRQESSACGYHALRHRVRTLGHAGRPGPYSAAELNAVLEADCKDVGLQLRPVPAPVPNGSYLALKKISEGQWHWDSVTIQDQHKVVHKHKYEPGHFRELSCRRDDEVIPTTGEFQVRGTTKCGRTRSTFTRTTPWARRRRGWRRCTSS